MTLNHLILFCLIFIFEGCQKKAQSHGDSIVNQSRIFQSGFESVADFSGFYITPQNTTNSAHDLVTDQVHSGIYSHKGWILGANNPSTSLINNNHRAYPTVQLYKTEGGGYKTPALIEFWVWLDLSLSAGQWFSFATFDHTTSDAWDGVLVNLSDQGLVHLMHVPLNGQGERLYQTTTTIFPQKVWVKITVEIHFDSNSGYAKVWQNEELVSWAEVRRGSGSLTQAHFGLYAPPELSTGIVYNDGLIIKELTTHP